MIAVAGIAVFFLRRTGYRWPMVVGFVILAAGLFIMSASPHGLSPYAWLAFGAGISGIGIGMSTPSSNNATLQLAPDSAAAIAGLRGMFRQAGSIAAVSITTATIARSANPGITLGHVFVVFAVIVLCTVPLIALVPEHRGGW
jgi:fucose permease